MFLNKTTISCYFILFAISTIFSQNMLFNTNETGKNIIISKAHERIINYHQNDPNVENVFVINVEKPNNNSNQISFIVENQEYFFSNIKMSQRTNTAFTWFGKNKNDESGIFFTVQENQVASKFTINNVAYTLIPLKNEKHILIKYQNVNIGNCATEEILTPKNSENKKISKKNTSECKLRVLIATTPQARQQIVQAGFDLKTFAQLGIDESNLAYINSNINLELELAVLLHTNYNEYNGDVMLEDVTKFRNGTSSLAITHQYKNFYETDLQVLIRKNEPGVFGRAFTIPLYNSDLDDDNGFCVVSVNGITTGRFSFVHELGHLQGAKHNNDNRNPQYSRGHVTNNWRTIMAISCGQTGACRIGNFSNPNVSGSGGVPTGKSDRNNALRLNETSNGIKNYRQTPNFKFMSTETINSNQISNHKSANQFNTYNNTVIYESGSNATISSGSIIILNPGVHIKNGANFNAFIGDCNISSKINDNERKSNELQIEDTLIVFPNPTNGQITIQSENPISNWTITNQFGNFHRSGYVKNNSLETEIDINELPTGLYFLETTLQDGGVIMKTIIKE